METNPVGWFEIYVQEVERAKKFYEAVFQLELQALPGGSPEVEMWAFPMEMERPGAAGALVKMKGYSSSGNGVLVYFSCADCSVEAGRAVKAGGKVARDKMSIGEYGYIALVNDTEGNMVGLHSRQ